MKTFSLLALCIYTIGSLTAMASMNLSFLMVAIAFSFSFKFWNRYSSPELKSYFKWGILLFSTCLLSLVVAKYHPVLYSDHAPEVTLHGFLKIWYLFIPGISVAVFLSTADHARTLSLILKCWGYGVWALLMMAIIQFFTGWPLKQEIPTFPGHYHAILLFGHHLSTSSILIFPTFTALAIAVGAWVRKRELKKFDWAVGVAGLIILFLSYARTAWLAIPLGVVLLFVRYLKPRTVAMSVVAAAVLVAGISQTPAVKSRIENGMGISERVQLWKANIDFFTRNPVTGIGWLKTAEMSEFYFKEVDPAHYREHFWGHAHNNFFEMLGGTGILGLLAFLAWSIFTLRLAYRVAKEAKVQGQFLWSDTASGLGIALILLHFNGLTNVTFWEGKVMHSQMLAVAILLMIEALINKGVQESS